MKIDEKGSCLMMKKFSLGMITVLCLAAFVTISTNFAHSSESHQIAGRMITSSVNIDKSTLT